MLDEKNFKKSFGIKINKLRKQKGMTQSELAEALNYSDKAISKWERQESVPDAFTIYKISKLFGVSIDDLFNEQVDINFNESKTENINISMQPIKIFVPFISSLGVFFLFSLVFFIMINTESVSRYAYLSFLFAVPIASLVLTVFTAIWWKLIYSCIFTSTIIWSTGIALFFTLNIQAVWFIFIPCLILQVLCLLVYSLIYYMGKVKK